MTACSSDAPSGAYVRFMIRPVNDCSAPGDGSDEAIRAFSRSSIRSIRFSSWLKYATATSASSTCAPRRILTAFSNRRYRSRRAKVAVPQVISVTPPPFASAMWMTAWSWIVSASALRSNVMPTPFAVVFPSATSVGPGARSVLSDLV